jgi:hypothetical protein
VPNIVGPRPHGLIRNNRGFGEGQTLLADKNGLKKANSGRDNLGAGLDVGRSEEQRRGRHAGAERWGFRQ